MPRKSKERLEIERLIGTYLLELEEHQVTQEGCERMVESCDAALDLLNGILNNVKGEDEQHTESDG